MGSLKSSETFGQRLMAMSDELHRVMVMGMALNSTRVAQFPLEALADCILYSTTYTLIFHLNLTVLIGITVSI